MSTESNGNIEIIKPVSSSNEDLSEYTDADESISAPTEFLAEFLSAVMLKDYETALKYCKLILQYEPNNATAKEFYPLIIDKLQMMANEDNVSSEDENEENSSSNNSESGSSSGEYSEGQEEEIELEVADKGSKGSSDGDATTGSYSSLEDDEAEELDQLAALAAKYHIDNVDLGNGNKIYNVDTKTAFSPKIIGNSNITKVTLQTHFGTSSDSESPTEPVSQQTIALLRANIVPNKI